MIYSIFPKILLNNSLILINSSINQISNETISSFSLIFLFSPRHHARNGYQIHMDRSIQAHYQMANNMPHTNSYGIRLVHIQAQRQHRLNCYTINCPTVIINTIHIRRSVHNHRLYQQFRHRSAYLKKYYQNLAHI